MVWRDRPLILHKSLFLTGDLPKCLGGFVFHIFGRFIDFYGLDQSIRPKFFLYRLGVIKEEFDAMFGFETVITKRCSFSIHVRALGNGYKHHKTIGGKLSVTVINKLHTVFLI